MAEKTLKGFLKFVSDLVENLTDEDISFVLANQQEALGLMVGALRNRTQGIFRVVGKVCVPATTERFVVKENFVVGKKEEGKVPLTFIWDFFQECFSEMVEEPLAASTLICRELLEPQNNNEIVVALGGKEKAAITLQEFYAVLRFGDKGKWYVAYILDASGSLRCVHAHWGSRRWYVHANSVEYPLRWLMGRLVVSRNS
jgi:hypothetical protein